MVTVPRFWRTGSSMLRQLLAIACLLVCYDYLSCSLLLVATTSFFHPQRHSPLQYPRLMPPLPPPLLQVHSTRVRHEGSAAVSARPPSRSPNQNGARHSSKVVTSPTPVRLAATSVQILN